MSYIKPPTKEEKAAYWEKFQTVKKCMKKPVIY